MSILITGASGFVGRELVRAFSSRAVNVRCLNGSTHQPPTPDVEFHAGSLSDLDTVERALTGVEAIVHLGATPNGVAPSAVTRMNYGGTLNLVEAARRQGVKRVVVLNVLGANPTKSTPLVYSKWLTEETVKRSGLGYTVLRSSVIIGEEDRFLLPLVRFLRRTVVLPLPGLGRIRLQPVWVGDVVRCLIQCLEDPHAAGRTYAIGGPEIFTFHDLVRRIVRFLGAPRLLVPSPLWLFRAMFRRDHSHSLTMMVELSASGRNSTTDPAAVASSFQFYPRPFEDVLASVLSHGGSDPSRRHRLIV